MGPMIKVEMPGGLEDLLESLTRAILKSQPADIFQFAVQHFQDLLDERGAQSSGLSPSPTEETAAPKSPLDNAENVSQDESKLSGTGKEAEQNPQKPTEEPESCDTSYGVEATAVRTLAASTGTVAILGTTAKVLEQSESPEPSAENRFKDNPSISVTEPETEDDTQESKEEQEKSNESEANVVVNVSAEVGNDVLQQKEIKQIENEALHEKLSEKRASQTQETPVSTDELKDEKTEKNLTQDSETKISQNNEHSKQSISTTSAPTEVDQIPKIVDFQEKKGSTSPAPLAKDVIEKESSISLEKNQNDKNIQEGEGNKSEVSPDEEEDVRTPGDGAAGDAEGASDTSKTEEDVDISSERLKTNSLSDVSLSEIMNSEGEELAREAAKAQELKEMVESLSASANEANYDYGLGVHRPSISHEQIVGTSFSRAMELEAATHETITEENSPETNGQDNISISSSWKDGTLELLPLESDISEPVSNGSHASSKPTEESKLSDKEEAVVEEGQTDRKDTSRHEVNVVDNVKNGEAEPDESQIKNGANKMESAATTIQSTFRGFKTRKDLKDSENANLASETETQVAKDSEGAGTTVIAENKKETDNENPTPLNIPEDLGTVNSSATSNKQAQEKTAELKTNEKNVNEALIQEKSNIEQESISKEITVVESAASGEDKSDNEKHQEEEEESRGNINPLQNAPGPLVQIAQAEVDRICTEAERTTESIMTPPPAAIATGEYQDENEEFPAPPDDMLDTLKEDQDSSNTEPTIPLGTNTEGDSSKTEDTTAPSLAESEIKSNGPSPSQENAEQNVKSPLTEDIPKEAAVKRESTNEEGEATVEEGELTMEEGEMTMEEGELTMEEDSKEEDMSSVLQAKKEGDKDDVSNKSSDEEYREMAAIVIQAGYRGFKTRKNMKKNKPIESKISPKEETDSSSKSPDDEDDDVFPEPPPLDNDSLGIGKIHQEMPKRPDQINIAPPGEELFTQGGSTLEDTSPAFSESKDDTSSTSLSEEELNEKASKIQAGIRGYLVRKEQKAKREAAVKIQSTFRGFKTRQRLKQSESN